jgi:hypothetical protein
VHANVTGCRLIFHSPSRRVEQICPHSTTHWTQLLRPCWWRHWHCNNPLDCSRFIITFDVNWGPWQLSCTQIQGEIKCHLQRVLKIIAQQFKITVKISSREKRPFHNPQRLRTLNPYCHSHHTGVLKWNSKIWLLLYIINIHTLRYV